MLTFTRQELHDRIWADPMRTVAQQLGLSDVGLKEHCAAANIPAPERGYWAKLAAGKAVAKTPLPPRETGASETIQIGREDWRGEPDPEKRLAEPLPAAPVFSEPLDAVRARVERRLGRLKLERDLASPHAGLRKLLEAEEKRVTYFAKHRWGWDKPLFESGFEKRRLRLLNSLAVGLSKLGVRLEVRGKTGRSDLGQPRPRSSEGEGQPPRRRSGGAQMG